MNEENKNLVQAKCKWQKEIKYLKYLPYYAKLSEQADQHLADIKTGIGCAILLQEFTPGLILWGYELGDYITLHGYRFTKEDHILFIKIFYELLCTPNAELEPLSYFCVFLKVLLQKPRLLTREDLELDWRPLFNLYHAVVWKKLDTHKTLKIPKDMPTELETLINYCRVYFSLSSTREILNEFRPFMCPVDSGFDYAITCMYLFLPTDILRHQEQYGYLIWLDEILYWFYNTMNKEAKDKILLLITRLPYHFIYHIDLDVFLPYLFSQILRSFEITLCGRSSNALALDPCAYLVVSIMGGENKVQGYITQLFEAVESYVHPSNVGPWQYNILQFMYGLAANLTERIHLERYQKRTWYNEVPNELQLTDDQIDSFVSALLPCALSGMFDTEHSDYAAGCLRALSHLSPKLIVHKVLDSMFDALEMLTEPHRLIQSLTSVIALILPFVRETGPHSSRNKVIPLMTGILPALDTNDFEKCILAINAFKYMFKLVSIVDCQNAITLRTDLSEDEKKLCSDSASFNEFVDQFMDKMFLIVESFGSAFGVGQSTPLNEEDKCLKDNIYETMSGLLGNCSNKIYESAVNRIYNYVAENLFERLAAAEILGQFCAAAVATDPAKTFGPFLHLIADKLADSVTDEMNINDDENCSHVLWYLHLLEHILLMCDGAVIVKEKKTVEICLKITLPLKSKEVSNLLSEILLQLLYRLTHLYVLEQCDSEHSKLNRPLDEYLPIRDWAKPCSAEDANFQWHITNADELEFAKEIIKWFLFDQLELLENPSSMTRDAILKSLNFIHYSISGSAYLLPPLCGPLVKVTDSQVKFSSYICVASINKPAIEIDGKNVRNVVYEKLHQLMEFILTSRSSEPKCLVRICTIFYYLIFDLGSVNEGISERLGKINMYTQLLIDRTIGKKSLPKTIHIKQVMVQHEERLAHISNVLFTEAHRGICLDLLKLCTNHYQEVRSAAQSSFTSITTYFPYTSRLFVDNILQYLKPDPSITDDELEGALCALIGGSEEPIYICHDLHCWLKVWPAIIRAQHCSEPSVIALLDFIRLGVINYVQSFFIIFEYSNESLEVAKHLWTSCKQNSISPSMEIPNESEIAQAKSSQSLRNENRTKKYYELINILVELSKDNDLHWRHLDMVHGFLTQLIRQDFRFPAEAVEIFCRLLMHDSLDTRKRGIQAMSSILKMHKKKAVKVQVKVKVCEVVKKNKVEFDICLSSDPWPIKWGFRKDNAWLVYNEDYVPKTEKLWNESVFIGKTCKGFYCWPNNIKICLPSRKNSTMMRSAKEFKPDETPLLELFSNQEDVEAFCNLMCIEEDDFDEETDISEVDILFFKGVFETYGDLVLKHFKLVVETIVFNKLSTKSEQKFAATFVAGLVTGAKHWPFEKHQELWTWLGPLMRQALNIVLADTDKYWRHSLSTIFGDRDPNMLFWLIEMLMDLVQTPMDTPYNTSNRISFLHACFYQQQWRSVELGKKTLSLITPLLAQPYQNLRCELGKMLTSIFAVNFANITLESKYQPANLNLFLSEVLDKLSVLRKEIEHHNKDDVHTRDSVERAQAILLLKTILNFFQYKREFYPLDITPLMSLRFMPLLCFYENDASDEELRGICWDELFNGLAQCLLDTVMVTEVLEMCKQCVQLPWWKLRISTLRFLRVSVFSNLFVYSTTDFRVTVKNLVLSLLEDQRLEVRDTAMETLSGLLHCKYLLIDENLLKTFHVWTLADMIIKRHAGVLGLSAVIKSCPYNVPKYLPRVIMDLCQFKSDIQPIRNTVESTLNDFKRTHQDSWREHKDNFAEDQLFVLTKVMIAPTYYV